MSDDYQIEMLWDCDAGHKGNRGRFKTCESCGRPKTEDDEFYMPGDTSRQAAVIDREQLKYALGGENWHCRYCNASQRRPDGNCAECGSDQSETVKSIPVQSVTRLTVERLAPRVRKMRNLNRQNNTVVVQYDDEDIPVRKPFPKWLLVIPGVLLLIGLFIWAAIPREYDVVVADVYFQHGVHIEKYQVIRDSGWNYPHKAFDVEREGKRIHHHDRVEDGWEKEWYTERVRDGESCRSVSIPKKCRSNKNGYATCSGGGSRQECTPKYRDKRDWRKKTKYKDVPVYQEWYSWKAWEWRHDRDVFATGHTLDVHWPSEEEIALCKTCTPGEEERIKHDDRYTIKFADKKDTWNYTPSNLAEFKTFPVGSKRRIKVTLGSVMLIP